jgi:hypothetical protein
MQKTAQMLQPCAEKSVILLVKSARYMKKDHLCLHILPFFVLLTAMAGCGPAESYPKTTFQTSRGWQPNIDVRADAVMVYGSRDLEKRVASWQERGYRTDFMTGIAWGGYEDYFTGKWDGRPHWDEGQVDVNRDTIWHGKDVPYIVPSEHFLAYFKETQVRRAIDAGMDAIYLEEPEFWARAGYSEAFKREWEAFYGVPWMPQDATPAATYLSNKLKYHLYYRALDETFTYAKQYGRSLGRDIRCYVPTHSLLNYSMWEIVSPEASLAALPCVDGYIAQVWTGTSRVKNYYDGRLAERVFETAFLEYGCMASMTSPTGRKLWLLTDPVEDATRDWDDFRKNYQATFTAQLLFPRAADYEVMPWPERIYGRPYPVRSGSDELSRIPADYATTVGILVNALQQMPRTEGGPDGTAGIAVLMGNSLMFQSFPVHAGYEDPQLSHFFGLAFPLLKAGVPVGIAHMENMTQPQALKDVKVLLMSYANQKPLDPAVHQALCEWVRQGGRLLYAGEDRDPFQGVPEWWNQPPCAYSAPSEHLFELLGLGPCPATGKYACGKGEVLVMRREPKTFVMEAGGQNALLDAVEQLSGPLQRKSSFRLSRGPYEIVAVLDETGDARPLALKGPFIDLFDPALPVCEEVAVEPGSQRLLYALDRRPKGVAILAEAGRSTVLERGRRRFCFLSKGPAETISRSRISLPRCPDTVSVSGSGADWTWDEGSRSLLLQFNADPDGVRVELSW